MTDLVAVWKVALSDRVHKIEFEHGTASGKRVVYVNGKKVLRKEWMFSLIGKETFCIGASKIKATINIKPRCASSYDYTLEINGKSLKEYMESRKKTTNTWILHLNSKDFRVVLEKDTMDVWCNGKKMKTVIFKDRLSMGSCMLQLKILHATTKTQHSLINICVCVVGGGRRMTTVSPMEV
ncbi:fas apoptotic inhibitory molecule 1-like isoform X2 [Cervus elaphus]|uniref:fas apoptotic inhibitory molecule 1-like isoform X2 n=1 Tax=Cervus elaphus TaxID=9860 RepID=UPI001CC2D79E|nr:fas apoptotic inhibitory molecule 1-like isoform X2 [Cervus elaphus]